MKKELKNVPVNTEALNILKSAKEKGIIIQLDDGKNPAFLATLGDISCVGETIWDAINLLNKVMAMQDMIKFYNNLEI